MTTPPAAGASPNKTNPITITPTIILDEKQARAFAKRIEQGETPESLAASLVVSTAQGWADHDYTALSNEIMVKLKSEPLAVLDGIVAQLTQAGGAQ